MSSERRWLTAVAVIATLVFMIRIWAASSWALLADEAYYWVWSGTLQWGYYDQPPGIAGVLALARIVGESPGALRAIPVAMGAVIGLSLLPFTRDRALFTLWVAGLPPFFLLTVFATPDAMLLGAWAVGLAGALAGGPGWILAGVGAGVAMQFKYTGVLLLPLAILGSPKDLRTRWPWLGVLAALGLLAPHLLWSIGNDWVALRFQLGEGLLHPTTPGGLGLAKQLVDQLGFVTPIAFVAVVSWGIRSTLHWGALSRTERVCWMTSCPVLVFFAVSALFAPPEAHWPIPAYIGAGVALSHARGWLHRMTEVGCWLGLFASVLLVLHTRQPLLPLPTDPATRITEGPYLGEAVRQWAAQDAPLPPRSILTERYQEAALIHYYTGIPAVKLPGCGRRDQYDLWGRVPEGEAIFVRPGQGSRAPECVERASVEGPHPIVRRDAARRRLGPWQVWTVR